MLTSHEHALALAILHRVRFIEEQMGPPDPLPVLIHAHPDDWPSIPFFDGQHTMWGYPVKFDHDLPGGWFVEITE